MTGVSLLVTGGSGFVGAACVRQAVAAGWEVHALGRRMAECPPQQRQPVHAVDLRDCASVGRLMDSLRPTHLLHLAWVTTPGQYWTSPANLRWVEASLELVRRFAAAGGSRAVLVGSCAEYDWSAAGVCHETSTPLRPATLYGRCKDELRRRAEREAAMTGLPLAWARLFFLYGPGEHPMRLIPSVARALLAGEPAPYTAGTQLRDFMHVDDAAAALLRLVASDLDGPCNVASGRAVSVRSVVELVAAAVGRPELLRPGARALAADEPPLLVADIGRLRDELGCAPPRSLAQGIAETVSWWRSRHRGTRGGSAPIATCSSHE